MRYQRISTIGILISVAVIFLAVPIFAADLDVAGIQAAIDENGAEWTAVSNWVTRLTPEERKRLAGAPEMPDGAVEIVAPPFNTRAMLSNFDWRNHGGTNWMTSVKNQRVCGACAAFAAVGAIEANCRIEQNNPNLSIDLSEQALFSCGGGSCATGWYINDAMDYAVNPGIPDENCLPYTQSDDNCSSRCSDWSSRSLRISSWDWVTYTGSDETALKNAISQGPITCRMNLYEDFYSYGGGVYRHVTGAGYGGHFVVMVGWDDADNSWICKNSWGLGWGMNGYFKILRGDCTIGTYAVRVNCSSSPPAGVTVAIAMPSSFYYSGDTCWCKVTVETGATLTQNPLFVVLDVYGNYFFGPQFNQNIDWYSGPFAAPSSVVDVLPAFSWPYGAGSASNIHFYSCVTDPGITALVSNFADFSFGWSSSDPPTGSARATGSGQGFSMKESLGKFFR